jgi:hypothetical protein
MEELLDEYYAVSIHQPQKKCNVCNCWITNNNFKRHLMSKKHSRQVEWNLQLGITPVEWEKEE